MSNARFTLLACALAAGCAGQNAAQPHEGGPEASGVVATYSEAAPPPADIAAVSRPAPASEATPEAAGATPHALPSAPAVGATKPVSAAKAPVAKAEQPARATKQREPHGKAAADDSSRARVEVKSAAAVPVVSEPIRTASPAAEEIKAEPALKVADLTTELRETPAIGTFTKLALKNQMDDLLQQFRTTHQSGQRPRAAGLRQPFDALVGKLLSLLQPGDPALARKIEKSREGLWNILSDPEKFKSVT